MQDLYTLKELADELDVHYVTVLAWKKKGYIRVIRIGGTYKVPRDEVLRLKQQGNHTSAQGSASSPYTGAEENE